VTFVGLMIDDVVMIIQGLPARTVSVTNSGPNKNHTFADNLADERAMQASGGYWPGLGSPGPIYNLPGAFDKAALRSKHPTLGRHATDSLKGGRFRCEEVRFYSGRHQREKIGHYSPGPQYLLPGTVGGSTGNLYASTVRLSALAPQQWMGQRPGGRVTLSAMELGAYEPAFTLTTGSFADRHRPGGTSSGEGCTAYWRSAAMLQPNEQTFYNSGPHPERHASWHESGEALSDVALQDDQCTLREGRFRPPPRASLRQARRLPQAAHRKPTRLTPGHTRHTPRASSHKRNPHASRHARQSVSVLRHYPFHT
jgi:hypothetical protein